jgi:UMF1 family MFS transporter
VRASFGQLWATLRDLRNYPVTLTFLVAYLFYNDGIQTVIYAASVYGERELGFEPATVLSAFLVVQFIGVGGALLFGRIAGRVGSRRVILGGLVLWIAIVAVGYVTPARSFFSLLIPRGREAEYFSLYQAAERGTSWLGTLIFGLVQQLTGSYRPALVALAGFFVVGLVLLWRVKPREGIAAAGNEQPAVV